ncbi:MAG: DinB family protein [Reichenbachiella sp.]|uniref:DinB family protein n=1 Tax=Reichenbachiella sp. TaxID=2184521 RepID=UPI00326482EB
MDLRSKILTAFESLEQKRSLLENQLDEIETDLLAVPEGPGKWSVNQVLVHLSNAEFGTLRYIQKKMQGIDSLKPSNAWSGIRAIFLKWLLDSSLRYKMPKQLPEPSNETSYEELRQQFDKNRASLKSLIETFPEEALDKLIFRHPFAGRFSMYQTVLFLEEHYKHHLRQVNRILQVVANRGKK